MHSVLVVLVMEERSGSKQHPVGSSVLQPAEMFLCAELH